MALVAGLAAAVPFDKAHPGNPVNRRISILVMTKEAVKAALERDLAVGDAVRAAAMASCRLRNCSHRLQRPDMAYRAVCMRSRC